MAGLTLLRQHNPLSSTTRQRQLLEVQGNTKRFDQALRESGLAPLRACSIEVLQVNVGKVCNQTCHHCHVDAGPDRRESMSHETMAACLHVLESAGIPTLDITGGAPEMNPNFRWLVNEAHRLGRHIVDRCNLTILLAPRYEDLPEFLAEHRVEIVASLPCYLAENTNRQRGEGVFERSIQALRRLNDLGYGRPETGLMLKLVYNPLGPQLPPDQQQLETAYRKELHAQYGVVFNRLFTITNMPISRFLDDLVAHDRLDEYMRLLVAAYNPRAAASVMCRTMLSVGWDGRLYDCDFNQMLDLELGAGMPRHISQFDAELLRNRPIVVGQHCFGCTAGCGSGCSGAIVS
ncbi:MAG: arsenosugar biosynthesis radical SAM (seleno)protein ArsS [Pirellulales bacterium]